MGENLVEAVTDVLIVEDDGSIQDLLIFALEEEGLHPKATDSVQGALKLIDGVVEAKSTLSPAELKKLGRLALYLDRNFNDDDSINDHTHPELFADSVMQHHQTIKDSKARKAAIVARYAILRMGIDNVGFILSTAALADDQFKISDILTPEEQGKAPVWLLPKPFGLIPLLDAAQAIREGRRDSYRVDPGNNTSQLLLAGDSPEEGHANL